MTYYIDSDLFLYAFRRDSAVATGPAGQDTIFYSYPIIQSAGAGTCLDTAGGSVLGRKVLKRQDGWFLFFTNFQDTVFINTQAAVGQYWRFCNLPDNGYLQATVDAIEPSIILGLPDLVKIISFQAKNSNNLNISNIFNQKQIRLSKQYGLASSFNLYWMPADTSLLTISGKTYLSLGVSDLTWQSIYDYEVGDEFHFSGGISSLTYGGYWKKRYRVLVKTILGNNDSVQYLMEFCKHEVMYNPNSTQNIHDTILLTYNWNVLDNDNWIANPPGAFKPVDQTAGLYYQQNNRYNGRHLTGQKPSCYLSGSGSSCWLPGPGGEWSRYEFTSGLGQTKYEHQVNIYPLFGTTYDSLVYFKKGSETWGTPVATTCDILVGINPSCNESVFSVRLFPNPADNEIHAKITLPELVPVRLFLYDLLGNQILEMKTAKPTEHIQSFDMDINWLSPGIYILHAQAGGFYIVEKVVIR